MSTRNPYPDGLHVVSWERLAEDDGDWRSVAYNFRTGLEAESMVANTQRRQDAGDPIRNIELRVYDAVERIGS